MFDWRILPSRLYWIFARARMKRERFWEIGIARIWNGPRRERLRRRQDRWRRAWAEALRNEGANREIGVPGLAALSPCLSVPFLPAGKTPWRRQTGCEKMLGIELQKTGI